MAREIRPDAAALCVQFALRKLLKPFAWAQCPMESRAAELQPPVTFIYGENDWMDPSAGERICKMLRAAAPAAAGSSAIDSAGIPAVPEVSASAGRTPGGSYRNKVLYIDDASHFPFMEKPDVFNEMLLDVAGYCLPGAAAAQGQRVGAAAAGTAGAHHGVVVDESGEGVTLDALETAFVDT